MRRTDEQGFVLLEVLILCLVVLACLGAMKMLDRAAQLNAADGARSQAIFLAREELERLNSMGARSELSPGHYNWLGDSADITRGGVSYEPEADVDYGDTTGVLQAKVVVPWQARSTSGRVELEGRVKNAGAAQGSKDATAQNATPTATADSSW